MTKLGERLLRSIGEARQIARGEIESPRTYEPPAEVDVAAIRRRSGLSQAQFARRYGFSAGAVRDWEQGRRTPEAAARTLLIVIDREGEAVERALAAAE